MRNRYQNYWVRIVEKKWLKRIDEMIEGWPIVDPTQLCEQHRPASGLFSRYRQAAKPSDCRGSRQNSRQQTTWLPVAARSWEILAEDHASCVCTLRLAWSIRLGFEVALLHVAPEESRCTEINNSLPTPYQWTVCSPLMLCFLPPCLRFENAAVGYVLIGFQMRSPLYRHLFDSKVCLRGLDNLCIY